MSTPSPSRGLAAHLPDVFERLGRVDVRRMFGGHGVFLDGLMFGLVVDETLYLKADAHNRPAFDARSLPAFTYLRQGRPTALGYCRAPDEVLEDLEQARAWGASALEAAIRARSAAGNTRTRRQPAARPRR